MKTKTGIALFILLALYPRCSHYSPTYPAGTNALQSLHIRMDDDAFYELLKSAFLDSWFSADLSMNDSGYYAELQIHGNVSKRYIKKSFDVRIFSGGDLVDSYILSAQFNDDSFCRYRLADYFFRRAGFHCPSLEPVLLFVNGQYEGLYLKIEKVDSLFFNRRDLPVFSLYNANFGVRLTLEHNLLPDYTFQKRIPADDWSYADMMILLQEIDRGLTDDSTSKLHRILDVENALNYYTVSRLINNGDGITNNLTLFNNNDGFQFIPWDLDATFKGPGFLPGFSNGLFEQFDSITVYHEYMNRRFRELFNFNEAVFLLDSFYNQVSPALFADPYARKTPGIHQDSKNQIYSYLSGLDSILNLR